MYRRGMLVISLILCTAAVSYGQRIRVAEWNRDARCGCINPFRQFEGGGGRGYGGGPVRSGARGYSGGARPTPRGPFNYSNREIEIMDRMRSGQEAEHVLQDIWRERERREAVVSRERDRMASRAPQATQPSRLADRLGLAPKIERRDLTGPFRGYLDSKALDRNVGGNTPQRRDSQERSRPDSPSRSGRSPSSRDTRERSAPTCSTARC